MKRTLVEGLVGELQKTAKVNEGVSETDMNDSASRLNDAVQTEMKLLAKQGKTSSAVYEIVTSAVEFLLNHAEDEKKDLTCGSCGHEYNTGEALMNKDKMLVCPKCESSEVDESKDKSAK